MDNLLRINVATLKRSCPTTLFLKSEIKRLLNEIQTLIEEANRSKTTTINFTLPSNFEIPNMRNKDAQIVIYGSIIEQLRNYGGFKTKLRLVKPNAILEISWKTEQDIQEMEHYKKILCDSIDN